MIAFARSAGVLLISTGMLLSAAAASLAAKRVALVIGNDEYEQVASLQKAVNDAKAVGDALKEIGYDVLSASNASRREMNRQIQLFAARIETGDEALFFYAGHGVEIEGRNYLLPIDIPTAQPGQESFIKSESVPVDEILDSIRNRGARVSILVLDACRDNPFPKNGTRSLGSGQGLARTVPPEGTFIMYSAGVGQTALDRLSDDDPNPNSVFTRTLIPLIKTPGMSLVQTAKSVRRDVERLASTVAHDQRPGYYDEVTGDFFFAGEKQPEEEEDPDRKQIGRKEPVPEVGNPTFTLSPAAQAWATIERTQSTAILQTFINRFSDTIYADFARARLEELQNEHVAILRKPEVERPQRLTRAPVHDCDRLAAHPENPDSETPGVDFDKMDKQRAIAVCAEATRQFPEEKRFAFQLARAHDVAGEFREALRGYRELAEKEYAQAMSNLGVAYEQGRGVKKDPTEAAEWYLKAAEHGSTVGMNAMGRLYRYGTGVAKNENESTRWYIKAAEADSVVAMNEVGTAYEFGRGVGKDLNEAARWYRRGAEKDEPLALFNLGRAYANGIGVTLDHYEAVRWYRKAIEKDQADAMNNLGWAYANGYGVPRDDREAFAWYRKAADKGVLVALRNVGRFLADGRGVTRNDAEAVKWFRQGADKGDAAAMNEMGVMTALGRGIAKDDAEAVRWYQKAADAGDATAMSNLGVRYSTGEGLPKDDAQSIYWLRRSADAGYASAMTSMGWMYENGRGVSKDIYEAARWFQKGSDNGDATGHYQVARLTMLGSGVAKDNARAAQFMMKALQARLEFARKEMTTNANGWNIDFRRELQRLMRDAGYYNGSLDGQFGAGTKAAIDSMFR